MRVLLVTQFFPPETAAGANRAGAMAAALHERFDVRVVTLEPGYRDPAHFVASDWRRADADRGFAVRREPAFRPHGASLVRRALREMGMSSRLLRTAGEPRPDLVLVTTPSMFLGPVAWGWARRRGARFAWDVRDLTWAYARESVSAGGVARALLGVLERVMLWHLRRADLVIGATEGLSRVLERQGVRADRLVTLSNGVSLEFLEAFADEPPRPVGGRPRVSYVGLMGYNHGIGILCDVASRMPHVDFVLVGDGPERPAIEARLADGGPANVRLAAYETDRAALLAHYRASDVLVNHTKATPTLNDIVYPAKTFEYFASRRPVVYAGAGFAADLLRERDLAAVVPPGDPAALALGIEQVLADPDRARDRAARARTFVEAEHCREAQLEGFVRELERRFG